MIQAPLARAARTVQARLRPPEGTSAACLNCGTPLSGPYCSACGQRDIPPYPSTRELLVDAFWELSGWDGRFAATVRALFTRPGGLTREFLEGRRARFISPLRLYLMASLVYFLLAALTPTRVEQNGVVDVGGVRVSATESHRDSVPKTRAQRVGAATVSAINGQQPLVGAARDSVLNEVNSAPAILRPLFRRVLVDPAGFKRGMLDAMPRALFALVPVFALIVAVFYRARRYPEHLYFGIHLHAFTFLALSVVALARLSHLAPLVSVTRFFVLCWIPIYTTLAFRRVYGGSMSKTLAKEIGIGALYSVAGLTALLATIYVVALWG